MLHVYDLQTGKPFNDSGRSIYQQQECLERMLADFKSVSREYQQLLTVHQQKMAAFEKLLRK